jgi:hypothetical protein
LSLLEIVTRVSVLTVYFECCLQMGNRKLRVALCRRGVTHVDPCRTPIMAYDIAPELTVCIVVFLVRLKCTVSSNNCYVCDSTVGAKLLALRLFRNSPNLPPPPPQAKVTDPPGHKI